MIKKIIDCNTVPLIHFGENSVSLSADDKFIQRVEGFDNLTNVKVEISGEGYHDYEFAIYKNGNTAGICIEHHGMTFLITGEKV